MDSLPPLYLIIDRATCAPRPLEEVLARALDAGVRFVQLREKDLDTDALRRLAGNILSLTDACGAHLTINTRAEVAVELGARGVHLPALGPAPGAVRQKYGNHLLIGCSTHTLQELERAAEGGADFVTYSPTYPPASKPGYGPAVGLSGLRSAVQTACLPSTPQPACPRDAGRRRQAGLPVFGLGGITPERVPLCRSAGAAGIAVMSGILAAENIEAAVRAYLGAWETS
jgi:thiamine-phosphate pyrophosphorylase